MAKLYTIEIRDYRGGGGSKKRSTATNALGQSVGGNTESEGSGKIKRDSIPLAAFHYAKQAAKLVASYEVSTIETRTGNAKLQQQVELCYDVSNKVFSIGESIATGFFVSGGNPVGAVVGAAVGVGMQAVSIMMAESKIGLSRSLESVTLAQNAIRIGAGGNRTGGTI